MADGKQQNCDVDRSPDIVSQLGPSSSDHCFMSETPNNKQDSSWPIPGFPPQFQFAKLQTEASSWNEASTSCSEFPEEGPTSSVPSGSLGGNEASGGANNLEESIPAINKETEEIGVSFPEESIAEEPDNANTEEKDEDGAINDEPDEEEAESDPYFYTKRDEFTSEIYKIELQNLPKKCGYKVRNVFMLLVCPVIWNT